MREYLQLVAQRWYPDAAAAAAAPADAARTNGRDGLRPAPASAAAASPPPPRIDAAAQEAALLLLHRYNYDPVKVRHAPLVAPPPLVLLSQEATSRFPKDRSPLSRPLLEVRLHESPHSTP